MRTAAPQTTPSAPERKRRNTSNQRLVDSLLRENAALRRELAKLETFRTLAYRDPLTGLWNRRYFDERLAEELGRAGRSSRRAFSVMVADVNDLKRINDTLGHAAGDAAIVAAAQFLRETLRSHDVCCRTGGDEFAVIFPDLGAAECAALLTRVRRRLEQTNVERTVRLGLSFGTASYPDAGTTLPLLIESADRAMYRDKRRQKGDAVPASASV